MIVEKRNELEEFIREQIFGPGAIGYRILNLADKELLTQPFGKPLNYQTELINIIPAGLYSTGILFPEDRSTKNKPSREIPINDGDKGSSDIEEDDDDSRIEEEQVAIDAQSLNQMYPTAIGLTVCLDKRVATDNDLQIVVSGRYYTKLNLKKYEAGVAVLLEQDKVIFSAFLTSLPKGDFIRESVIVEEALNGSSFITLKDPDKVRALKSRFFEIKKQQNERLKIKGETFGSIEIMKESLFNDLRKNVLPSSEEGIKITTRLKEIEQVENSLSHLLDLINLHDTSSYGVWKCTSFEERVAAHLPIPVHGSGRHIYSYKDEKTALADVLKYDYAKGKKAALSINLQFHEDEERTGLKDRLFLKVQLINTSTPFTDQDTKQGKNYFSLASEEVNRRSFFGVQIKVKSKHLIPSRPVLLIEKDVYDEDEQTYYNYRQFEDFGVGHGCSVKWEQDDTRVVRTEYIPIQDTPDVDPIPRNKKVPFQKKGDGYEPPTVFHDTTFLEFKWLSTLSDSKDEAVIRGLKEFIGAYEKWIDQQEDPLYPGMARHIRQSCRKDLLRMQRNLDLLQGEALQSFRLMNTAMFMQLWHGVKAKKGQVAPLMVKEFAGFFESFYREKADDRLFAEDEHAAWRPFQLAFILLNLDGIFQHKDDPEWTARNEQVDLVWFPTGGGKTEAYLGLIALTIIHRRRQFKEEGGGTAVIMRYTLRLLTTQQFQRATLLIMALELIRRWGTYPLGKEPIYIGLYVGGGSLPNKLKTNSLSEKGLFEEYTTLQKDQKAGKVSKSRVPLRYCPWCGHELNEVQFFELDGLYRRNRILLGCSRSDKSCAFSLRLLRSRNDQGPIPVSLCDEEIYQHPPALLFGTVDKFAQIAHRVSKKKPHADSRRLFGTGEWEDGKPKGGYLPPDLIIQDELHLMMGPLGSAVALFESAIDQLCTRPVTNIRPKVISSTATTRNTQLQIMALFDRTVNIFPKPGIDCDDSFFAFYKRSAKDERGSEPQYISKRRYMGILPTGRTQTWMQLHLSAILLTHRAIFENKALEHTYPLDRDYEQRLAMTMDYYHTVLSYFNSLREVGKTESQIYTYLIKEIRRVFNKVLRHEKLMQCFYTYNNSFRTGELTGRLSGEEVVDEMASISTAWSAERRLAHEVKGDIKTGIAPPDLVVATNMISVGIDISRFNSMVMNCMPRNIAEYIQATSRVARDKEGLVITVHHPFRSRDISHYERFIEFHEKMYSYVEPISITPFTRKALDRYLPLYIATMVRHRAYIEREDANIQLTSAMRTSLVRMLTEYFNKRKLRLEGRNIDRTIKQLLTDKDLDQIKDLVEKAITDWQEEYEKAKAAGEELMFNYKAQRGSRPQRQLYVDIHEYQDNIHSELWRIPQSLRVVEPEAVIHVYPK
jgi:hypothetical protein